MGRSSPYYVWERYCCLTSFFSDYRYMLYWATVCKTVHPMLSVRCLPCPVCNVRALWPNSWTDQDETWHAGRPRPWPHCVRWRPSSPPLKGHSPQFSAHICCVQVAAWIKMSLGMVIEDLKHVLALSKTFPGTTHSFAARGRSKFGGNRPPQLKPPSSVTP